MILERLRRAGAWKTAWFVSRLARGQFGEFLLARRAIRKFGAVQRTRELMELIHLVREQSPGVILEIGTKAGGTLYCWARVSSCDALLISVDLPDGEFGGGYSELEAPRFKNFLRENQRLSCLRMDSHSGAARESVVELLEGKSIDFLFIDGDHRYEGVRADFENFSPLVRPGGLIAFHDTRANPGMPAAQVHRFWEEIKNQSRHLELIDRSSEAQFGMGIGVLVRK